MVVIRLLFLFCLISCTSYQGVRTRDDVFSLIKEKHKFLEEILVKFDMKTPRLIGFRGSNLSEAEKKLKDLGVIELRVNESQVHEVIFGTQYSGVRSFIKIGAVWSPIRKLDLKEDFIVKDWYYHEIVR